jgi:23S rRNA (adenine2503-C2)-methyltransferase
MHNLYAMTQADLEVLMGSWTQPSFRAKQIWQWVHDKGVRSFQQMSNLPKGLRVRLTEETVLGTLEVAAEQQSEDGTIKRLYRLTDGQLIEAVLMPYNDGRRTACISSQAGCAMGCVFCATGQMGFARHLSSTEIFEQAKLLADELKLKGERLSNVVFMGMGEPLHNYDAVVEAVHRLNRDLGIGMRHITVSTVGLVPAIRRLADEGIQITLAISLHAANDADRSALIPVNKRWPLPTLIDACRHYVDTTNRRISFEWALINGRTDQPEHAAELGRLLEGLNCHVNLIPLNPTDGYDGGPTPRAAANRFVDILGQHGVGGTLRVRRGIDIAAGCGQLKSVVLKR